MKHILNLFLYVLVALPCMAQFTSDDYQSSAIPFETLNDGSANFNPIVGDNGTILWFTRTGHEENTGGSKDQDIWVTMYDDGHWSEPSNQFAGLNTERNDLIVGQSENTLVYILRYAQQANKELTSIDAYRRVDGRYVHDHVIELPELNISGSYFGFYVARDESFIIISMKGDFTFGKEDLYICLNHNGTWQEPVHMGARINTAGFEMSPFVSGDRKHLFFSSEGHRSYGKGDIFVSTRLDESWQNWSKPINLGPNINSEGFEAYFCLNEKLNEAYFFSDKEKEAGQIYRIEHKVNPSVASMSPHQMASGFVRFDQLNAMQVKLNLMDENDQIIQSMTTNEDGYFNLQSFLPDRDYKIAIDEAVKNEIGEAEIFLTNELGDQMVYMNEEKLGMFAFKVLSGNKVDQLEDFERLARKGKVVDKPTTITGKVATYGTLTEKVTLNIMDENNEVLKTVTTDDEGYFSFSTEAQDRRYFLSVDKDLTGLVDVYEVYLTNDNPEEDIVVTKTDKHLFEFTSLVNAGNSPISLIDERDYGIPQYIYEAFGLLPSTSSELSGYLQRGTLPLMDAEIELLNERDEVLGTVTTREDGYFSFDTDFQEGDYRLRLTDEQEAQLKTSEIFLAKNPKDVVFYLNDDRAGVFAFKKLAKPKPMTLYSLRTQAESGVVVNEGTSLRGRFKYKKLPEKGVTLTLLDEDENIVQTTQVAKDGTFEFDQYTTEKNYFISAETEGLGDIYEIYLSGTNKNVLVNRTNRFVFAFKVLPSQDVMLTEAYETDPAMPGVMLPTSGSRLGDDAKRSYHEFDLDMLHATDFSALDEVASAYKKGFEIVIRLFVEEDGASDDVDLRTLSATEIEPVMEALIERNISSDNVEPRFSNSDQVILIIRPATD